MATLFPFAAIVDQERMKQALILNAINPRIGGVLIRGERGTTKSTTVRVLYRDDEVALLPDAPYRDSEGITWLKVRADRDERWVSAAFLSA